MIDARVALPLHGAPSSDTLKPAIRRSEDSVHDEGLCLALAKAVGIDAVAAQARHLEGRPYLLVSRNDRLAGAERRMQRIDQRTCQTPGIAPELRHSGAALKFRAMADPFPSRFRMRHDFQ